MTPAATQDLLKAFFERQPARQELVRELQTLALELAHDDREKLANNAMAATDNIARTMWVAR